MSSAVRTPGSNVGRASVRGVELAWQRSGFPPATPARTLIWAHEGNSSRRVEDAQPLIDFAVLGGSVDLVRYDARAHGESGVTDDPGDYQWDCLARDQTALADALGVPRWVSAGASLGAVTALHVAVLAPGRVDALVLVKPPTAWEERAAHRGRYLSAADEIDVSGTGFLVERAASLPTGDPVRDRDDWAAGTVARMEALDAGRLSTFYRGIADANYPSRNALAALDVPTLVLAWTGDPVHPVHAAEAVADLIPGATLSVASTAEDFAEWTSLMCDFLG